MYWTLKRNAIYALKRERLSSPSWCMMLINVHMQSTIKGKLTQKIMLFENFDLADWSQWWFFSGKSNYNSIRRFVADVTFVLAEWIHRWFFCRWHHVTMSADLFWLTSLCCCCYFCCACVRVHFFDDSLHPLLLFVSFFVLCLLILFSLTYFWGPCLQFCTTKPILQAQKSCPLRILYVFIIC